MKKITILASLVVAILGIAIINENVSFARLTSNSDSRDVWCVGVSGSEVCVDSSGNFIPTTDDVSDLGTSSLQFQDGYFDGTVYADVISNDGAYTGTTGSFTSTLNADGATTLNSTLDIDGNVIMGAALYRSTFTAATGALVMTGAITAPTFNGAVVGGAISGTTGTFSGDVKRGAANYVSTFTASSGSEIMTGAFTSLAAITGLSLTASGGAIQLYSRSQAQIEAITPGAAGKIYYCNDCTATSVCISSAAAVMSWVSVVNPATACD